MRNLPLAVAVVLFSTSTAFVVAKDGREYKGKDGTRVVILPIRKWTREPAYKSYESRLEFYSPRQELLCALDYSSEDSEHGFGIVKAAWTPDSNYFVFSLTSSGGHQAWHAPTFFYGVRDSEIHSLDSYVDAAGISKGDFTLKSPNIVLTEVWRGESIPIKFRLDSLISSNHKSQHPLRCEGGNIIRPES